MKSIFKGEWVHILLLSMIIVLSVLVRTSPELSPNWNLPETIESRLVEENAVLEIHLDFFILFPIAFLLVYLLFLVFPLIDPRHENYRLFDSSYQTIRLSISTLLMALFVLRLGSEFTDLIKAAVVLPPILGSLSIIIGNLLGKTRSNWLLGVRTPWTLQSNSTWLRTNRLAGWLITVYGVIMIPSGFFGAVWLFYFTLSAALLISTILFIYSYNTYQSEEKNNSDPSRNDKPHQQES